MPGCQSPLDGWVAPISPSQKRMTAILPMNLKTHKSLLIKPTILRFMGRIAERIVRRIDKSRVEE
jgi:hypothetical protein